MWYHIGILTFSHKPQSDKENEKMTKVTEQARFGWRKLALVLVVGAMTLVPCVGQAVTVSSVADLVTAIEAVNAGGSDTTINVAPGTYDVSQVHMNADGHLYISRPCTIQGTDATSWRDQEPRETAVIFDAKDVSRIFYVNKSVNKATFRHLTFQNAHARENTETPPDGWDAFTDNYPRGGAIATGVSSSTSNKALVTNCVFRAGYAKQGGGLYNCDVYDSFFTNNTTYSCGSAVIASGVYGCLIVGGQSTHGNGAARNCNPIRDTTFINNWCLGSGGGAFGGSATVSNCVFIGNSADGNAGALCTEKPDTANCKALDCVFIGNYAKGQGGTCYGIHTISGCAFTNNISKGHGGALYNCAKSVQHCTFFGNSATNKDSCGGAAYGCRIDNSTFVSNSAYRGGATYGGTNELCTFEGNWAHQYGGGTALGEQRLCTFLANRTWSSDWNQGGAGCHSATLVTGCVFRLNVATDTSGMTNAYGGGVMKCPDVRNCYFESNYAGKGGAGCLSDLYDCVITNCSSGMDWADGADAVGMNGNKSLAPNRIVRCKIYDCHGVGAGRGKARAIGGMLAEDCEIWGGNIRTGSATRCVFHGRLDGVEIPVIAVDGAVMTNCLVTDVAVSIGFNNTAKLVNCTVVNVSASNALVGSGFTAVNTLFANNDQNGTPADISLRSDISTFNLTNCLYRTANAAALTGVRGTGNIQIPAGRSYGFVGGTGAHPYSIVNSSPAREQGLAIDWPEGTLDLAGNARVNGAVDIGCYECYLPPVGTVILFQ